MVSVQSEDWCRVSLALTLSTVIVNSKKKFEQKKKHIGTASVSTGSKKKLS